MSSRNQPKATDDYRKRKLRGKGLWNDNPALTSFSKLNTIIKPARLEIQREGYAKGNRQGSFSGSKKNTPEDVLFNTELSELYGMDAIAGHFYGHFPIPLHSPSERASGSGAFPTD